MILKFIESLVGHRNIILIILALPLAAVFFLSNFKLQVVPPFSYVEYDVNFDVPGWIASTIEKKVTTEAERIFNGLPGLIALESRTLNEKSKIHLRFSKGYDANTILLFIQEKMDRLKLMLPSEVKRISIDEIKRNEFPDLTLENNAGILPSDMVEVLSPYRDRIRETKPELTQKLSFKLVLNLKKLAENKVAVDQVWKALQLSGLTYRLGSRDDIIYTLDTTFKKIEEINSTLIGARDDRPLKLSDVASITAVPPQKIKKLEIWLDKARLFPRKLKKILLADFPESEISLTKINMWFHYLQKPIVLFILLILLQLLLFYKVFETKICLLSAIIFDVLIFIHYFFWTGVSVNEITIIDITSFFMTFIVGTMLWIVLLGRIRTYFMPSKLPTFIQRGLTQAILFSIAEFLPSFIMLFAMAFLFSIPLILSDINLPSQVIMNRFILYGAPLLLALFVILPLLTPLGWVMKGKAPEYEKKGILSKHISMHILWFLMVFAIGTIVFWYFQPMGIYTPYKGNNEHRLGFNSLIKSYRGHGENLTFHQEDLQNRYKKNNEVYNKNKVYKQEWMALWDITPNGLGQLGKYDITMFQTALSDIQQQKSWGDWDINGNKIPLIYEALNMSMLDFSKLMVGARDMKKDPISIGLLLKPTLDKLPSQIFRSQLTRVDELSYQRAQTHGNFLYKPTTKVKKSPITKHWFNQYHMFLNNSWIVLVFTFILSSLYLNSFFRGGVLTIISFSVPVFISIFKLVTQSPIHLDSMWFMWLPVWMLLAVILLLSRMVDVERLRGNDRDVVLHEMEINFSSSVFWGILYVGSAFFILGLFDFIPWSLQSYFFREGILIAVATIVVGYITYYYFFRLFYISGDEFMERLTFKIFGWVIKLRYKRKKV